MKQIASIVALLVLAIAATYYSLSPKFPVAEGLDLQGGMRVTLEPDYPKITPQDLKDVNGQMPVVRDVLENRVNSFGLSGSLVQLKGNNQILITLPGVKDPQKALDQISKVAQMEFRHLAQVDPQGGSGRRYTMHMAPGDASNGGHDVYTFTDSATNKPVPQEEVLQNSPKILDGKYLESKSRAEIDPSNGEPIVTFEFKPDGARTFGNFTTDNRGEILGIVLDNKLISAPKINEPITEGKGRISGGFKTMDEARTLANLLNSGSLPVPLRPAETQIVGATLGRESVNKSIHAGMVGLGLVLAFMVLYYWLPGVIACIALLFYAVLTFWIFKGLPFIPGQDTFLPQITMDLPGITGFILSVGMAVDANILIFERLKEELRSGKTLHAAVDAGFKRAFTSIFDSNVTTWIVCAVLIYFGKPMIRGFAVTLALGVAVSMFTAITVTRTILHLVMNVPSFRNERFFGLHSGWLATVFPQSRQGGVLHVFAKRKLYLGVSVLSAVVAAVFIAMTPFGKGLQPGIDFTGGSSIEAAFRQSGVTREQVESALQNAGVKGAMVTIGQSNTPWTKVAIDATDVDELTKTKTIPDHLQNGANLRGFDPSPDAYVTKTDGTKFHAEATFTNPVNVDDVRKALTTKLNDSDVAPTLKGLNVTATPQPMNVPVALIQAHRLDSQQLAAVRGALQGLGGGIVQPLYQESFIGPSVAREVTWSAFWSVFFASLCIVLYLAFRFAIGGFMNGLKFGTCAVVALVHDVGIIIGLFALLGDLLHWQVDSLFVTACLTVLGFSVHDTIVVYDRIRENLHHRQKGETFADVSDRSITQTFDRSINTSFTVLLVVAALAIFGGESVRQFNVALLFGIAIGTYSSIFVASPLVVLWERASAARAGVAQPLPAAAPRPAAPTRRNDPSLTRSPRPETRTTPRAGTSTATLADTEANAETDDDDRTDGGTGGGRSGSVRPRKKRRM